MTVPFFSNPLLKIQCFFRLWNYKENTEAIEVIKQHSEFNYGLDWNSLRKNQLADCGWDSLVHIFSPKSLLTENSMN